ncbi:MAG: hypothetical protein HYX56_00020 [Chloroflexi bacterium]|nr:hypothetical protein [Chloroflexota bacterium]
MLPDLATLRVNTGVTRAFQWSFAIFTLTVLIGLANASKIFGVLSRDTILTHVHSGTLGFITMAAFGLALWVFGGGASATSQRNVMISALATAAYILAFWSGNLPARAAFGAIELAVIVGWWWWIYTQVRAAGFSRLDIPRLSVFLAFTVLVVGSSLGVAMQVILATGTVVPTGIDVIGGHAVAQVSGYLVLMSVGIGEWRLRADRGARSRSGLTQTYLLFGGGLSAAVGVLLGIVPLLLVVNLFYVIAAAIFVVRSRTGVMRAAWGAAGGGRHFAIAVPFLVLNVALLTYLISKFAAAQGDPSAIPLGLIVGYDHTTFVGVLANVIFGSALTVSAADRRWPWADHAIFWLLNVGVLAFVGVLVIAGYESDLVRFTAPIMGIGALLGIATLSMRLSSTAAATPAAAPMRA